MKFYLKTLILALFVLSTLAGCCIGIPPGISFPASESATVTPLGLTFFAIPQVEREEGEVSIELGVNINDPKALARTDEEYFRAYWVLYDEQDELRARGEIELNAETLRQQQTVQPGTASNVRYPMQWWGELEPGTYDLVWGAPGYGATVDQFTLVETEHGLQILEARSKTMPRFPPELLP